MKFLALFIFSALGIAASDGWKDRPSVDVEYKSSAVVFVGEVTGSKEVLEPNDFIRGTIYTLRVQEVLKGKPQAAVEVYSENTSGRFPMNAGGSYLVFAYAQVFEGIEGRSLTINAAGNSSVVEEAGEVLVIARKLSKQPASPESGG